MKLFIIILLTMLLISCKISTESKISHAIKSQNRYNFKIENIKITDTLYYNNIHTILENNEIFTDSLKTSIKNFKLSKDSIFQKYHKNPKFEVDSLLKNIHKSIRNIERDINFYSIQLRYLSEFNYSDLDSIIAFTVDVYTKNDTHKFVIKQDFSILCPQFYFD